MSGIRASRTAGIAAAAAALVLGLFAASAVGWYDEGDNEETTPTETTPTLTTPTETTPTETTPAETTAPPVEATQPLSAQPPPGIAAPLQAAPVSTPTPAPEQGVKGEFGTRDQGQAGGAKPTVLAQATEESGAVESESEGQLAQTGFDVLVLAILGGFALAGSGLLFWRSRTA